MPVDGESSQDRIDYGTSDGSAYDGDDLEVPRALHDAGPESNNDDQRQRANPNNQPKTFNSVLRFLFSSAGAWSAVASVLVAGATIFYTVYAHRQWVAMSGQLSVMQDANAQAKTTAALTLGEMQKSSAASGQQFQTQLQKLDDSIKQASRLAKATEKANANLVDSSRPWMGGTVNVTSFEVGSKPVVNWSFMNSGKRPAIVVHAVGVGFYYPVFPANPEVKYGIDVTRSNGIAVVGSGVAQSVAAKTALTLRHMLLINSGEEKYFAIAKIEYLDIQTKKPYWTHICIFYAPPSKD